MKVNSKAWLWLLPVALLPIVSFAAIWWFFSPDSPPVPMVAFSDFMTQARADRDKEPSVASVSIEDREYQFTVTDPVARTVTRRMTIGPEPTAGLIQVLCDHGVAVEIRDAGSPARFPCAGPRSPPDSGP